MRELIKNEQLVTIVPQDFKQTNEGKVLDVDRPSANKILSIILLLPEPFGPDIVVNPFNIGISTLFANDLKLSTSSCFMYIKSLPRAS